MSASKSSSSSTNNTQTIADSYNKTFNETFNLSDSGNISISTGGGIDIGPMLPFFFGIVGLIVMAVLFKK